jgi:tRNA dimethylallyltransferase
MSRKILHLITGPTASGKTDRSIDLALSLGSPIVSCDSRQIFKEMKIGTAPPDKYQLAAVSHYFIHSHSIFDGYTAGRYEIEAINLLETLFEECNNVVMVGGSGLYADAVCYGIDDFPAADKELRISLTERVKNEGVGSLRKELKMVDPDSYHQIDISNPQRVVRALEVTLSTGKPFSAFKSRQRKKRCFDVERINIELDRDVLYERINKRVDLMIERGLLDEVRSLYEYRDLPALKTVGYRELFEYLDGKISMERAVELIKRNTRRYAKRQITWFKKRADY